jgi:5'-nucleotidase
VTKVNLINQKAVMSFIQISKGITISYNTANNNESKLVEVIIGDSPLDKTKTYNVVTLDFLALGGDNIFQKKTEFAISILRIRCCRSMTLARVRSILRSMDASRLLMELLQQVSGMPTRSSSPTASTTVAETNAGSRGLGSQRWSVLSGAVLMGCLRVMA